MIGNPMEVPFQPQRISQPDIYGSGRKIITRRTDIDGITLEMADPARAIRERAMRIPPILPVAEVAMPPETGEQPV